MRNLVHVLLAPRRRAGAGHGLSAALSDLATALRSMTPEGAQSRVLSRLAEDPMKDLAHGKETVGATSYEVLVELSSDNLPIGELTSSLRGLAELLTPWVDLDLSAALAGVEHTIVIGEQPIVLVMALRRLPSLTSEEFHDYWLHKHAEVGRSIPGSQGYRQLHADPEASMSAADAAGVGVSDYEGAAVAFYEDLPYFLDLMSKPEITEVALADERRFLDHSRSMLGLFSAIPGPQG